MVLGLPLGPEPPAAGIPGSTAATVGPTPQAGRRRMASPGGGGDGGAAFRRHRPLHRVAACDRDCGRRRSLRRGLHGDEPLFWDRRARRGQPMPGPKGVRMPGFFGYCGWAVAFLIPVFILATFVFFR